MGLENSWGFPDMTKIVPVGEHGSAEIRHYQQNELLEQKSWGTVLESEAIDEFKPAGVYAQLLVNKSVMMDDSPMERHTHSEFYAHAYGHVLIGGLGLGMVTAGLLKKSSVETVTVLDLNEDVISLVAPHIRAIAGEKELRIIHQDVFTYEPDRRYDAVWMDIWPTRNPSSLAEMQQLRAKYGTAPVFGCWYEKELYKSLDRTSSCLDIIAQKTELDSQKFKEAFARDPYEAEFMVRAKHGQRFVVIYGQYGEVAVFDTQDKDRTAILQGLFGFDESRQEKSQEEVDRQIEELKQKASSIGFVLRPDLNALPC